MRRKLELFPFLFIYISTENKDRGGFFFQASGDTNEDLI